MLVKNLKAPSYHDVNAQNFKAVAAILGVLVAPRLHSAVGGARVGVPLIRTRLLFGFAFLRFEQGSGLPDEKDTTARSKMRMIV